MFRTVFLAVLTVLALSAVTSAAPQRPGASRNPMSTVMHNMMELGMVSHELSISIVLCIVFMLLFISLAYF